MEEFLIKSITDLLNEAENLYQISRENPKYTPVSNEEALFLAIVGAKDHYQLSENKEALLDTIRVLALFLSEEYHEVSDFECRLLTQYLFEKYEAPNNYEALISKETFRQWKESQAKQ